MKSALILKILNYVASGLGIVVIAAGGIGYVNNIDAKTNANGDRIGQVERTVSDFNESVSKIASIASDAKSDAAATRAYTEFLVTRLGGDKAKILRDASSTTQ